MTRLVSVLVLLLAPGGIAWAQTQPTTGSQEEQQDASVQSGAGTKGDVTAGASGPQSDDGEGALAPYPVSFEIRPPVHPFHGPGMLPVEAPGALRCDVIEDASARSVCEDKAARLNGG